MVKLLVELGLFNTVAMITIIAALASMDYWPVLTWPGTRQNGKDAIKPLALIPKSSKLQLADLSRLPGHG
jgi:hypothetical protein